MKVWLRQIYRASDVSRLESCSSFTRFYATQLSDMSTRTCGKLFYESKFKLKKKYQILICQLNIV